jgi:hypothetical protein
MWGILLKINTHLNTKEEMVVNPIEIIIAEKKIPKMFIRENK